MARRLKLEITETAAYLEKSLKQAKNGARKERLQMLWWLKTGSYSSRGETASSGRMATPKRFGCMG